MNKTKNIHIKKYIIIILILLLISIIIGTLGFKYFTNLNWIDCFYNACLIFTTTGIIFEPSSNNAKFFISLYSIYSSVFILIILTYIFTELYNEFNNTYQILIKKS